MAELIRRFIDAALAGTAPSRDDVYARAAALLGRYQDHGQATDLAERHDAYLAATLR